MSLNSLDLIKPFVSTTPGSKISETSQNLLNEINQIARIENLPEALQYLPRGSIKQKNQVLNYNNTQIKPFIIRNKKENKPVTKKNGKTQKTQETQTNVFL